MATPFATKQKETIDKKKAKQITCGIFIYFCLASFAAADDDDDDDDDNNNSSNNNDDNNDNKKRAAEQTTRLCFPSRLALRHATWFVSAERAPLPVPTRQRRQRRRRRQLI